MLKRIVAVTALGLALGLAACDQAGQEQAQTPNRGSEQTQQQGAPPANQPPPSTTPSSPAAPPAEQTPSTPPAGGTERQ